MSAVRSPPDRPIETTESHRDNRQGGRAPASVRTRRPAVFPYVISMHITTQTITEAAQTAISLLTAHPYITAAVIVAVLATARRMLDLPWRDLPWGVIRRVAFPVLQRQIARKWGGFPDADMPESQHLATIDRSPHAVAATLRDAGFVDEPLAAYRKDWTGVGETASLAKHYGPRLFPGAPSWLKERQIHVRLYPREGGAATAIVGHDEYNSWRPDLVEEHLTDTTLNVDRAQATIRDVLDLEGDDGS